MFFWTETRRDGGNNEGTRGTTRRAFRPEGDRLESREVLSLFAVPGGTTVRFAPAMNFGTPVNGFTGLTSNISRVPGAFTNNSALLNSINTATPSFNNTSTQSFSTSSAFTNLLPGLSNTSALVGTGNRTASAFSNSASLANLTAGSAGSNVVHTSLASARSLPREAGLQNNVNTRLPNAGRAGGTFFPASSLPQSALSGAVSGLAFTGGLGFSTPSSGTNGVQNGLSFTNGSGFSRPTGGFNTASNGLAFTGGTGFSIPSRTTSTTSNGLAFTNNSGFSAPASAFNAATNGLSFTGGLGFTNPNTNPFRLF